MDRSTQRIVIKLGTSTLTRGTEYLNRQHMLELVQQMAYLHQGGHEVILVSSGAQAAGREHLNFPDFGRSVPAKQMLSAVGQGRLMHIYSEFFDIFGIVVGQVLLTRDDLSDRTRYLNARDTLQTLLERRIIPIINENDTVATNEIRVGDNDNLSAMVASILEADLLILLTDQPGLFTSDPRRDTNAELIKQVDRIDSSTYALAGGIGSKLGTGGMMTKIAAARTATRSGVTTIIASGSTPHVISRILNGDDLGTRFEASASHLESRKRWLLTDRIQGSVRVDAGAVRVLVTGGASLLPVGIVEIQGKFERGSTIAVLDSESQEIAHGLTNYSSVELIKLRGVKSSQITAILGYSYGDHVIHRNNMVLVM
ncbi:MAG: glutamate 5-kinase [Chloroflexota bacterium]